MTTLEQQLTKALRALELMRQRGRERDHGPSR